VLMQLPDDAIRITADRFVKLPHRASKRRNQGNSIPAERSPEAMICYRGVLVLAVFD
jgi:hypothetical protein